MKHSLLILMLLLSPLNIFPQSTSERINNPKFYGTATFNPGSVFNGAGATFLNIPGINLPPMGGHTNQILQTNGSIALWNNLDFSLISNTPTTLAGYGITDAVSNNNAVHRSGPETINDPKTFTSAPVVPASSFSEDRITNLVADLAAKGTVTGGNGGTTGLTLTGSTTLTLGGLLNWASLNKTGSSINDIVGTPSNRGLPKDVYISNRTDTVIGTGTSDDPFDGSTAAKLGAQLISAIALAPVNIHIAASTYTGYPLIFVSANNVHIMGDGMKQTLIQNTSANPTGTGSGGFMFWEIVGSNNSIEDISFDVNGNAITNHASLTAGAVVVKGSYNDINNVYVTRAIGNNGECFPLRAAGLNESGGIPTTAYGSGVRNSEVANFIGASATCIMVSGGDGADNNLMIAGYMLNNYVHDCPTVIAYGAAGNKGLIADGNRAYNVLYGLNRDTSKSTGSKIINSSFLLCHQYGIVWKTFGISANATDNDELSGNYVTLTSERSDSTGIAVADSQQTHTTVRNNTVKLEESSFTGTTNGTTTVSGISSRDLEGLVIGQVLSATDITSSQTITSVGGAGPGTISISSIATGSHAGETITISAQNIKAFDLAGGAGWIIKDNRNQLGFTHNITTTAAAEIFGNINDDGTQWPENALSGQWIGTATNDNASAGNVGELVIGQLGSGIGEISLSTGSTSNIVSIPLTAGDWDVTGVVDFDFAASTSYTDVTGGISLVSATLGVQDANFGYSTSATVPTNAFQMSFTCPVVRVTLASPATVYLVAQGTFSVSTLKAYGKIRARRVR